MGILYYFIVKFNKFKGLWIIDPPYGLGQEDWDQLAWGERKYTKKGNFLNNLQIIRLLFDKFCYLKNFGQIII